MGRPTVRPLRVLVAEDHEQVADLIRIILERAGYEVISADDGVEALQKIASSARPFDVLITDHVMPELNGLELVRALRVHQFTGAIIVQSARLVLAERAEYVTLGVTRFLEKPVRPEQLRTLLKSIPAARGPCAP